MSQADRGDPAFGIGLRLYWIPLGAGGTGFVRMNGRVYEAIEARLQRRRALDLYHTALEVGVPEGRFVVETMWPRPDWETSSRGVVIEAPVFSRWLGFTRVFRYEVRCWRDGWLPDATEAVGGPQMVSEDPKVALRLIRLSRSVPALVWGRDPLGIGDMWNSNSVVSWLLTRSGVPMTTIDAPHGGRAPGWEAGVVLARRLATDPDHRLASCHGSQSCDSDGIGL